MGCARQIWRRLGLVYVPRPHGSWCASHAAYPTPLPRADGTVRVFFSVRDISNRSHLASIDVALDDAGAKAIGPVRGPLLGPGPRGAFDADGVTVGEGGERSSTLSYPSSTVSFLDRRLPSRL